MKNLNTKLTLILGGLGIIFSSCGNGKVEDNVAIYNPYEDGALSQVEREALTPDMVLEDLREGNERFRSGDIKRRNNTERILATTEAQYPKAMILSCIDSRVPVEEVVDQGIGDLFIGRIAGNIADEEMLGSLEYATKVAGSRVVVVMGHQNCGAVKSAIADVDLGNITALLEHIKPAIEMTNDVAGMQPDLKNKDYVKQVIINNVYNTLDEIREESPIMAELEEQGEIKLVGAYYSLEDGSIKFLKE